MRFDGKNVYLSGPMTGIEKFNRPAFNAAEERVRAEGAADVFNPAHFGLGRPHESYMLDTLHALTDAVWDEGLLRYVPYWDVIAMLPRWKRSKGARVEKKVAEAIGVEVVEL